MVCFLIWVGLSLLRDKAQQMQHMGIYIPRYLSTCSWTSMFGFLELTKDLGTSTPYFAGSERVANSSVKVMYV